MALGPISYWALVVFLIGLAFIHFIGGYAVVDLITYAAALVAGVAMIVRK